MQVTSATTWQCRIVHRLPNRTRILTPSWSDLEAAAVLSRFRKHAQVTHVGYNKAARSVSVEHRTGTTIENIVASLPNVAPQEVEPLQLQTAPSLRRRMVIPAIALAAAMSGASLPAAVTVAACAFPIARRAQHSLRRRHVSIDVLDTVAVTLLIGTGDLLAAGVSVALIETGERIRAHARGRARRTLRNWLGAEHSEIRILANGSEPRVPVAEVMADDQVVVYAGEAIPVDGVVVAGKGLVDTQSWTGETKPVDAERGVQVLAGSRALDGRLVIAVRATGDRTRAGRLAAAIEEALSANTQISDMARRIADRFVLPIAGIAGLVLAGTGDVQRLISILIVDFGTGIRIAIPTTVLATMVAGARNGVLLRNGRAIEELSRVDTIVFDKTGTLTSGHPAVVAATAENGHHIDDVLALAAAAEGHLPHPIARAVRRYARKRGLDLPEPEMVRYRQGGGVEAIVSGRRVLVGGAVLMQDHGVPAARRRSADSSDVLIAIDGELAGTVSLRDRVRQDADRTLRSLREAGIKRLVLATGDRAAAARKLARSLHFDDVRTGMMPEDKAALVRQLRAERCTIAVVGDGINDAAAMAEAHVGIAMPTGAEMARETADVVLGGEDLMALVQAVRLARGSISLIRQNIAIVGVPNATALGMASVGALPPLAATAVNNGSTLVAALNALRALRLR